MLIEKCEVGKTYNMIGFKNGEGGENENYNYDFLVNNVSISDAHITGIDLCDIGRIKKLWALPFSAYEDGYILKEITEDDNPEYFL